MKPNIEEKDENGLTPLIACFTDYGQEDVMRDKPPNIEMVEFLLKSGANPNVVFNFTAADGYEEEISLIGFVDGQITKYEDEAFYNEEMLYAYNKALNLLLKYRRGK